MRELSNYMLYNFRDDPADLFHRMMLNVELNEELGIRIWSFPMRYQPTDLPQRSYVSERWSRYELRSLQIVLQATHGVVSGEPEFFRRAFGADVDAFKSILLFPHHFIFNREWYGAGGGRGELDDYTQAMARLSAASRVELLAKVSSCDPSSFVRLVEDEVDPQLKRILQFYLPISKSAERAIWEARRPQTTAFEMPPEDEAVEDAGLSFEAEVGLDTRREVFA